MKTALVFLADGFEEIEALSPIDYLRRGNVLVKTVAIPSETMKDNKIVTSSHGIKMFADLSFEEFCGEYKNNFPDLCVCPGGSVGAKNLSKCEKLLSFLEKSFEDGNYVSAICASPAVVLGKTNLLQNKNWTCYPGCENELCEDLRKNRKEQSFVTDGKLITARASGASEEFAIELVKILCGEELAQKIKIGNCMR